MTAAFRDPFGAERFPYRFVTLGRRCHAFVDPDGLSNVGVVDTDEGLVLVDTTLHPYYITTMVAELAARFAKPICHVVNTHFHRDHTFGNAYAGAGGDIIAHASCARRFARHSAAMHAELAHLYPDGLELAAPSRLFAADTVVLDGLSVEVVVQRTGGHTDDSCVVYVPEDDVCFAGDAVFHGVPPYLRQWSCLDHFGRVGAWIEALDRVAALAPARIVPGHGDLADLDTVTGLRRFFEHYADLVRRGVAAGRRLRDIWFEVLAARDFVRAELPRELYLHLTIALHDELTAPPELYAK